MELAIDVKWKVFWAGVGVRREEVGVRGGREKFLIKGYFLVKNKRL